MFDSVQALLAANRTTHRKRPTKVSTMPLKAIIFDADNQPMNPTFGHGSKGQVYRYYVSAPLQQGRSWQLDGEAIRRIPAEAIEELVLDRLQKLRRGRVGMPMSWAVATTLLKRIEIHADTVQLQISAQPLFGAHADLAFEVAKLDGRLSPEERVIADRGDDAMIRVILPVRLRLRGGRSWIVTPGGSPLLERFPSRLNRWGIPMAEVF